MNTGNMAESLGAGTFSRIGPRPNIKLCLFGVGDRLACFGTV